MLYPVHLGIMYRRNCQNRKSRNRDRGDFSPDIVFMDIHMPGINGIQAMREIRKFNTTALFYVVSAYDKFDYAKEAIDLGVERYLTKPISKAKILQQWKRPQQKLIQKEISEVTF